MTTLKPCHLAGGYVDGEFCKEYCPHYDDKSYCKYDPKTRTMVIVIGGEKDE